MLLLHISQSSSLVIYGGLGPSSRDAHGTAGTLDNSPVPYGCGSPRQCSAPRVLLGSEVISGLRITQHKGNTEEKTHGPPRTRPEDPTAQVQGLQCSRVGSQQSSVTAGVGGATAQPAGPGSAGRLRWVARGRREGCVCARSQGQHGMSKRGAWHTCGPEDVAGACRPQASVVGGGAGPGPARLPHLGSQG